MATGNPETLEQQTVDSGSNPTGGNEIDTSAPFESVKEAASRFGGMGFWKPSSRKPSEVAPEDENQVVDVIILEEQAAQLQRDLVKKERETLDVLKELERTKNTVEQLKSKLQDEASKINPALEENSLENSEGNENENANDVFILHELEKAKLNLTKSTSDLAEIRATVDLYNKKIEHERAALEKTRKRLASNTSKISPLEEELNQTKKKHAEVQRGPHDPSDIATQLSSETEEFKKASQSAKLQVQKAMSEIEQTKARIKTVEMRLVASKKTKEAARASEHVALAEIKALSKESSESDGNVKVTITIEEYSSLVLKAKEAERACGGRVDAAMVGVEEANASAADILRRVEEALEEVKTSKRVFEEALERVEVANREKLAVEEALRAWRSKHGCKRRSSVQNQTKFKNSRALSVQKEETVVDVGGEVRPVLKSTLSIGEILSRKLMLTEEYERGVGKRKVSLGQMLGKKSGKENKEAVPVKRKKFGFGRISVIVAKQSKKNKNKNKS